MYTELINYYKINDNDLRDFAKKYNNYTMIWNLMTFRYILILNIYI